MFPFYANRVFVHDDELRPRHIRTALAALVAAGAVVVAALAASEPPVQAGAPGLAPLSASVDDAPAVDDVTGVEP